MAYGDIVDGIKDCSQCGQQKVLLDYWKGRTGVLVEVGASDGEYLSNSKALIDLGWTAALIEPNPTAFKLLVENTKDNPRVTPIYGAVSNVSGAKWLFTPPGDVDDPLGTTSSFYPLDGYICKMVPVRIIREMFPFKIDLLLVDAEMHDYEILQGVDWDVNNPEMVVAEYKSSGRTPYMDEIVSYMQERGYELYHKNKLDVFFVKRA